MYFSQALELIVPESQGVIQETDLTADKTPVSVYRRVMEYLMGVEVEGGVATEEDMWEGGGDGHAPHSTRDEL